MIAILEKLDGKRIILVCEKNDELLSAKSIRLKGNGNEIVMGDYQISKARNCFSEPKSTNILLSSQYTMNDLKGITHLEIC